ncbi:MAG: hypothetical protein CBC38_02165 [Gammaproteobacteria bacterium TMED78]|nr:MAG: hypothetical protein CBC38_02165 [Gammaproteobacteria bacterium TMED78]|tara:strand:+ start:711 stop:1406 length:696 start_codon:yes stop_codon:yes gene_type:complete
MKYLYILLFSLVFSFPAFCQEWEMFHDMDDLFSINFPGKPEIEYISYPSEYGAVFPGKIYSASRGSNNFSLTVIDYTNYKEIHSQRTNKTEADAPAGYTYDIIDVLASIAYAASNYRKKSKEVTLDIWAHIDRIPGHQLQLTNHDGSRSFIGIFLHNKKLYIADATVPENYPPQGHFQQSLRFIDSNQNYVRYDYGEDHNTGWNLIQQNAEERQGWLLGDFADIDRRTLGD